MQFFILFSVTSLQKGTKMLPLHSKIVCQNAVQTREVSYMHMGLIEWFVRLLYNCSVASLTFAGIVTQASFTL